MAIDYKGEDVRRALREHVPEGVDVYFDNVGGEILDAVLTRLARGARIVICGAVSQYNATGPVRGPSNYLALLVYRASMTGMVVFDYAARFGEATAALAGWLGEERLISREHIVEGGVSAFPDALLKLFSGENTGKLVLSLGVGCAACGQLGDPAAMGQSDDGTARSGYSADEAAREPPRVLLRSRELPAGRLGRSGKKRRFARAACVAGSGSSFRV